MTLTHLQRTWLDAAKQALDESGRLMLGEGVYLEAGSAVTIEGETLTLREWVTKVELDQDDAREPSS